MKLDPVDQKALKGSLKSAKDKDINNDGKVNSSDEYLHKRRQAVSKALGKLKEETLDEKKLSDKDVKRALASAKAQAKPKETVSLKKPPFKMDEEVEELDEVSASTLGSYIRKASKGKEAAYKSREDALDNDDGDTARKMGRLARKREKGADMAMDKLKGTRYAKVHATEEVDLDESSGIHDNASLVKHFGHDVAIDARSHSPAMMFRKGKDGKTYALTKVNNKAHYKATPSSVKEEVNKDFIIKAIKPTVTDDTSIKTIADIKPLRMKLAHFRHHE